MYLFFTFKKNILISICLAFVILTVVIIPVVYAKNEEEQQKNSVKVPVLMYHSVLKNNKTNDKYIVTPETFENDIKYLKDAGYNSIFVKELSDYVRNDTPLPKKPVIITLDDGYYNNYVYVLPILEKYGMKASIAVVGKFTDIFSETDSHNANYSHLTWEDISEISKKGYIEFSNHTYDMHSMNDRFGCFKKKGENDEEYRKALTTDVLKMQKALFNNSNVSCCVFTYPYGKIYEGSIKIIKEMGFLASLSCYEKMNYITKDEDCLYMLGRFNRPSGISTENFMKKTGIF